VFGCHLQLHEASYNLRQGNFAHLSSTEVYIQWWDSSYLRIGSLITVSRGKPCWLAQRKCKGLIFVVQIGTVWQEKWF